MIVGRFPWVQVDVKELELQAAAHHRAAAAEERLKQQLDYQQEQWAQEVERRVHAVETCRRANESAVAAQQRRQAADKCERDQALREQHRNRISDAYFAQFGTSHR